MKKEKIENKKIYDFFINLDRSYFIDTDYKEMSCYDRPLPIGFGQTISQPSLVYIMTCNLELNNNLNVLEIGTGTGYQTAFLAEFSKYVFTVERIEELSKKAQKRLVKLGYKNVYFKIGDGSLGWQENAPYDRIIAAAAAGRIPKPLIEQLALNGKMIIPVGKRASQELILIEKDDKGVLTKKFIEHVRFVEMIGHYGMGKISKNFF